MAHTPIQRAAEEAAAIMDLNSGLSNVNIANQGHA